ncbi:MAG: gliding motility-associated C-terminal domain-containing protein, partial [Saprospiraceae bacterium]|nr:gliding motility-associated C-terminal domain-containing protein [Saprospiraceae bacterium]
AGTYTLTVTNTANGCSASVEITVIQNTELPAVSAGPALNLTCMAPTVTLQGASGTPGVQFIWSTPDGNIVSGAFLPNPEVDQPGVYILTVTILATGCSASATTTVNTIPLDFPSAQVIPADCLTPTGGIVFSGGGAAQGPFLYSIDGGMQFTSDSVFENLAAGTYSTVVQDASGCERMEQITLSGSPALVLLLEPALSLAAGEVFQLNPVLNIPDSELLSVLWSPGDWLSCTDCLRPLATPQADIVYQVVVTSTAGCTASASISIKVKASEGDVYLPNAFSPNDDGQNDFLKAYLGISVLQFELRIFDRWGGLLFETTDPARGWDGVAKGKPAQPGVYVYYVKIILNNKKGEPEERIVSGDVVLIR